MWSKRKLIFAILAISLISFFISDVWFGQARLVNEPISYLSYPLIQFQNKVKSIFAGIRIRVVGSTDLETENKRLDSQVADLTAENIKLVATQKYYSEIKEVVEFAGRYKDTNALIAQVSFKFNSPQEQYFLINKGSREGVYKRMVAVYKNSLVGKVIEVYPCYSKVGLITDRRCKIAVYCSKTKSLGISRGQNDSGALALNYISHLERLKENDTVICTGEGELFPQGFGVGKVGKFTKERMYYKAELKPLIDIFALKYCYLIRPNKTRD